MYVNFSTALLRKDPLKKVDVISRQILRLIIEISSMWRISNRFSVRDFTESDILFNIKPKQYSSTDLYAFLLLLQIHIIFAYLFTIAFACMYLPKPSAMGRIWQRSIFWQRNVDLNSEFPFSLAAWPRLKNCVCSIIFIYRWERKWWIHAFLNGHLHKIKCKQFGPGFEFRSPIPFPLMMLIVAAFVYIYIYIYIYINARFLIVADFWLGILLRYFIQIKSK